MRDYENMKIIQCIIVKLSVKDVSEKMWHQDVIVCFYLFLCPI